MKKRFISVFILCFAISMFQICALAQGQTKNISIRIEGIDQTIAKTPAGYTTQKDNVYDAVIEFLQAEGIPYEEPFGPGYIGSVNGLDNGSLDGFDGWMCGVNGSTANVGMADYSLSDGDSILMFYGGFDPATFNASATTNLTYPERVVPGKAFTVNVKGSYDTGGDNHRVTVAIEGAKVEFNGAEYVTDSDGNATLTAPDTVGSYDMVVTKFPPGGHPEISREQVTVNVVRAAVLSGVTFAKDGAAIDRLQQGVVTCTVNIDNGGLVSVAPTMALALYKGNKLVAVGMSRSEDLAPGSSGVVSASLNVAEVSGCRLKAMVFEDMAGIQPLGSAVTLK